MNQRIRELAEQAGLKYYNWSTNESNIVNNEFKYPRIEDYEKFAELIVRECIKTIEYRAPGQMGEVGKGWTNGYDDGLKTGAWLLKDHFGVGE